MAFRKKSIEARLENGETFDAREENMAEINHHHMLRCLEATTVKKLQLTLLHKSLVLYLDYLECIGVCSIISCKIILRCFRDAIYWILGIHQKSDLK